MGTWLAMNCSQKYCMKCHQLFHDNGYNFCPLCASALIMVVALDDGLYQVMELVQEVEDDQQIDD